MLDAAVLATYCWGAFAHRQTSLCLDTIRGYVGKVAAMIDASSAETSRRGDRCTLLEARAMLAAVPGPGDTTEAVQKKTLEAWRNVVKAAEQVAFFPIGHIAGPR